MPAKNSAKTFSDQLLGNLETRIAGMQYYENVATPGESVSLEREPENPHDSCSIRVENSLFDPIGHIPRRTCSWLAPLVDSGKVRVDGRLPELSDDSQGRGAATTPLTLSIFLCQKGQGLLAPREVHTKLDGLHEVVRRTYEELQGYTNPDLILELAKGLRPLTRQELLPETRLLLALIPAIAREVRANQGVRAKAAMQELLGTLTIGKPLHHHNLTVFPLSWPELREAPYVLLGQAIEQGVATVEEVDEDGDVPNLSVTNNGERPVLILEGDILVGAKQNRVVNVTVLVDARSQFTVPVSCVEQGRWEYRSRQFDSRYCAPPSLRSKQMRAVHENRARGGTSESNQSEVWDEVSQGLDDLNTHSPTSSLTDGFDAAKEEMQQYREGLPLPEDTAGVLMVRGDQPVGMDLFDSPDTLQELWGRLSDAYFFDALRNRRRRRKATRKSAKHFLQEVVDRAQPRVPSLGLGDEWEITGDVAVGNALLYSNRICHLAAFAISP